MKKIRRKNLFVTINNASYAFEKIIMKFMTMMWNDIEKLIISINFL